MNGQELDYAGLGRFLAGAGVDPEHAEAMVTKLVTEQATEMRSMMARELRDIIADELTSLGNQQRTTTADARHVITKIRTDLDIYQRVLAKSHADAHRMIVIIVVMHAIFVVGVLAGLFAVETMRPGECGANIVSAPHAHLLMGGQHGP